MADVAQLGLVCEDALRRSRGRVAGTIKDMNYLDYTQTRAFLTCPWKWYERYVRQLVPLHQPYQRDDTMTIGSLVHAGLENWGRNRRPEIPEAAVAELNPTPDAFNLAQGMVHQYVRVYPEENWAFVRCEEPLRFPLGLNDTEGLAKIDKYFYLPEAATIETGLEGEQMTLSPGWWIHEYKTKSAQISHSLYAKQWESGLQADFQVLALQHELVGLSGQVPPYADACPQVQGVLVQVLEKPRVYIPKRKCKGCSETIEMSLWMPATDGASACPMCGNAQVLKPYEPKAQAPPTFYRLMVTRTPERLVRAARDIVNIAFRMEEMRLMGFRDAFAIPNSEACVNSIYGPCEYFEPHTAGMEAVEGAQFVREDTLRYANQQMAAQEAA